MPAFVLAIAGYIGTFFTATVSFLALFLTKRVAATVAGITVMVTLTAALWGALLLLIQGLSVAIPGEVLIAASWVIPDNALACVAAVLSAHVLRFVYDMKVRGIQMRLL